MKKLIKIYCIRTQERTKGQQGEEDKDQEDLEDKRT